MTLFFFQSFFTKKWHYFFKWLENWPYFFFNLFALESDPTFLQSFCTKKWPNFFFNLFALKNDRLFCFSRFPRLIQLVFPPVIFSLLCCAPPPAFHFLFASLRSASRHFFQTSNTKKWPTFFFKFLRLKSELKIEFPKMTLKMVYIA